MTGCRNFRKGKYRIENPYSNSYNIPSAEERGAGKVAEKHLKKKGRKVTLYIENFRGTLEVTCENCHATNRIALDKVSSEGIKCECGSGYFLLASELQDAKNAVRDINKLRKDFGL